MPNAQQPQYVHVLHALDSQNATHFALGLRGALAATMTSPFETLTEFLRQQPYAAAMRVELDEQPRVIVPAVCESVGDLVIYDDGDELTVYYGNFTHCHYGPAQFTGKPDDWDAATKGLADDLDALFSDRLVLWGSHQSRGGIYRRDESPTYGPSTTETKYVWSGPISS